ncbi:glycosyltransferase family 2 protein [Patescibacteria group bacterium]|nr:glycosyltransferase family 2 protein [Patescibacteria group bacterium]
MSNIVVSQLSVSVIIPNFNGEKLLAKNLPKVIEAKDNKKNKITEIIVVDDGSSDGSVNLIKSDFPTVKLIKHKINRGFSAAVNIGVKVSKSNLVCLINNDVVPEKDFLVSTFKHFKKKDIFAVSLHEKGYGWAKGIFENGYIAHFPGKEDDKAHLTFWVNGGSGVFRKSLWKKLGGMDEILLSPFYWEDLDLCYRALKRGYKLYWEPKACVVHKHETTIGKLPKSKVLRIRERNHLLFIWKNLTSPNLFRKHVGGLLKRLAKHPGYLRIVIAALLKLPKVKRARKKEKKETKVSDEAIFASF